MNLTEAGKRIHEAATRKLTALDLSGCRELTVDTLVQLQFQKLARHLKILRLTDCILDTDAAVTISEHLPYLTQLYISFNYIGDDGARAIAQNLRRLRQLFISSNNISEKGAIAIAQYLHNLTELDIYSNNIGEPGATAIAQNLQKLTQLDIESNNIGEIGAIAIAQNLQNLAQLHIGLNNIGDGGVTAIAQNLKNLAQLDIYNNNIEEVGATSISQNLKNLTKLNVSFNNIGDVGAIAIAQNLKYLTHLGISLNNIGDSGAMTITQNLKNLTQLDISFNNIGDGGALAIAQNLKNPDKLDISNTDIGEVGATAIAQNLKNLTQLDISNNNIGEVGAMSIVQNLKNLAQLHISSNNIGDSGAAAIAQNLKNLTELSISDNKIGGTGAWAIALNLRNLAKLHISSNNIGDDGARAIAQNLKNLAQLRISNNDIGEVGAMAIALNLKNLAELDISSNNLGKVGATAIAQSLKSLAKLHISSNNVGDDGATAIAHNLKNLAQLHISSNNIGDDGATAIAQNLQNLVLLYISSNKIGEVGATAIAQNLQNLTELNINSNNIGDKGLKALILSPYLRHTHINIVGNNPQSIPRETANDIDALRAYFEAAQKVELIKGNVLRIVLCGNTRAGKTSLATKLMDIYLPNPDEDERTHGIRHWSLKKTVNRKDYNLNIWDFGGQDYYHATHAASLSATDKERDNQLSLYLLVWRYSKPDIRPGCEEESFQQFGEDYWLGFIHLLAGSPNITLLQTHTDKDVPAFPKSKLINQEHFAFAPTSFRQLCLEDKYIVGKDGQAQWSIFYNQLISSAVKKIDTSAEKIPATWQQLREAFLPNLARQFTIINREELEKLLLAAPQLQLYNDIPAALGYEGLLSYLKGCGDILYWNEADNPLRNTVVLNIEQFHKDIYEVLLTDGVRKEAGIIKPQKGYEFHISYLLQNGLIFERQESPGIYVAPQYLPVQPLINHFKQLIPRTLILRFPHYMPRYLITRCIVQVYQQNPKNTDYWKYGCISAWKQDEVDTNFMVAINPDTKEHDVLFYIKDTSSKFELLRRLYGFFASFGTKDIWPVATERKRHVEDGLQTHVADRETADLQSNQIPEDIISALQLSTDGESFVEVQEIKKAIKDKQYSVKTPDNSYTKLNTIMQQLVDPNAKTPKKIFFSYSRYEREYLEEFKVHFATLRRQGLIETWFDGELDAGEDANAGIMKELVNADIIICLLSPRFMANDYIWHIEMEKAKELKKTIVPITIKRCDYKGYFADFFGEDKQGFLTQKQFDVENVAGKTLKHDVIWIGSETHEAKRDEYYAFIIEELKKIILK